MGIKDKQHILLGRELESKQLWERKFKANAASLKWNLEHKLSAKIYPDFKVNFGAFPIIFLGHLTYNFEAQEVINPMFQTIHESKLKQRR